MTIVQYLHGSPADRGAADSYYGRKPFPHKRVNGDEIELAPGTAEHAEYMQGYNDNENLGNFKTWGDPLVLEVR